MHELSLAEHLLTIIEASARQDGFKRVHRVVLGLGRLSCVDPETLLHCITHLAPDTLIEGADIGYAYQDAQADCLNCHSRFVPTDWPCACPHCGHVSARLAEGRDKILKTLEVSD